MPTRSRTRTDLLVPSLILLLAAGLRIARLGVGSVWWDEGFSVWLIRHPLGAMLYQTAIDVHPPLYYLNLAAWRALAGETAVALRLLTVLWGVASVALVYRAARMAGGHRAGVIAALLVAVSPLWVAWSQEMRMYAHSTALAALALWAALKLVDSRARHPWRWAIILAVAESAGLLTLFLFAGVVVVLNAGALVAFLTSRERWKLALRWGAAQAAALAVFLPWYLYSSREASWQSPSTPIDLWFTLRLYLSVLMLGIEENIERFGPLIALAGIVLAGAAYSVWRDSHRHASLLRAVKSSPLPPGEGLGVRSTLLLGVILPPLLMAGLFLMPRSERFNIAGPAGRYFLVMSVPVYVLLGWGLAVVRGRWRLASYAALAGLVAVSGWSLLTRTYPSRIQTDDYASLAGALETFRQPGDAVLLNNDFEWPVFAYHYPADYTPISQERIRARRVARDLLKPTLETSQGVWLIQTPFAIESDPDGRIPEVLAARAVRVDRYSLPLAELWFYALTPERAAASVPGEAARWPEGLRPASMPISDGASLAGAVVQREPVSAGSTLGVGLAWRVEEGSGDWPVALRLATPDGSEIASTTVTLSSPAPGDYYLPVTLFVPTFARSGPARLVLLAGQSSAALADLAIEPTRAEVPPSVEVPPTATRLDIRFGEHIRLVAAEFPAGSGWQPGDTLPLTLYWSTDAPLAARYKVFTHLSGEQINPRLGSKLWGQDDQEPGEGFAPTTLWQPGAVIRDEYEIPIMPNTPPGEYRLEVGLYLPVDFSTLPAFGADGGALGGSAQVMTIVVAR